MFDITFEAITGEQEERELHRSSSMHSLQPAPDPTISGPLAAAHRRMAIPAWSKRALQLAAFLSLAICLTLQAISLPFDQGLNADSVAYLDLADLIQAHQWPAIINAYWHPGYPALLALMRTITRLPLARELDSARLLNLLIASLLFLAVRFTINSAIDLRDSSRNHEPAVPTHQHLGRDSIQLLAAAVTFLILIRDLDFVSVRPDTLLAVLLIFAAGCLMRICARRRYRSYAATGLCFGIAFLVKSIAFPLFLIAVLLLILLLLFNKAEAKRAALGITLSVLSFTLLAGPYIAALSIQKGRFTAGDSGSLNYAWSVDIAQNGGKMANSPLATGLAKGDLKHPPQPLTLEPADPLSPELFYYPPLKSSGPIAATSPRWLDPSYWNDGLKLRFNLPAQLHALAKNISILAQYVILRTQILLLLAFLLLAGARWSIRDFALSRTGLVLSLATAQIAMYLLVALEPRYIGSAVLLWMVLLLTFLRIPSTQSSPAARPDFDRNLQPVAAIFLGLLLCASFTESLKHLKTNRVAQGTILGTYDSNRSNAAAALSQDSRVHAGDQFASLENWDFYWARLAHVSIAAEADTDLNGTLAFWQKTNQPALKSALKAKGVRGIVAQFGSHTDVPHGWQRLGDSDYFVLFL